MTFGFRQGIDFAGGTLWQIKFADDLEISNETIKNALKNYGAGEATVTQDITTKNYFLRLKDINENDHQLYLEKLTEEFGQVEELRFESIGPSIGAELRRDAYTAVILVLIAISVYIAIAFRKVSYPVSSWKYGMITLVTLFHDVAIPAGILAFMGYFKGIEIDTNFIVALLVVMGFSVHDTIVVFDRIRENLMLSKRDAKLSDIVNNSVNETLVRSVNTSLTLIIVLVAMYVFGPLNLQYFIMTILIGTLVGTYSSIFLASPLLVVWHGFGARGKK